MNKRSVKDAIVNTAIRLFYKQGYTNTGINQIIEEAQIAKSSLYQHFRSKEDLLMAYLEVTGKQTLDALREAAKTGHNAREKIFAIFNYLEQLVQQDDFYGCHFLNMVYELPENASRIKMQVKKQKDELRSLFAEVLAPTGKEDLADQVYILFEGALIANKVHGNTWPVKRAQNIIEHLV